MMENFAVYQSKVNPIVFITIAGIVSLISSLGAPLVPKISDYYHISPILSQWSLTIALISGTISTLILAKIADFGNHRTVAFITLVIVMIGCFLSAYAPNFSLFLIGRMLQGVGLGVVPSLMIAARDLLDDPRKTISILSLVTGIGLGLAYLISGVMATYFGISKTFWVGGVITLVTVIISTKLINLQKESIKKIDIVGSVLITMVLAFLILLLSSLASNLEFKHISIYFIGFFISLLLWGRNEAESINPIVSRRVIKMPESFIPNLIALLSGAVIYMLMTETIFRIQQTSSFGLSKTPLMAGLTLVPLSVSILISRFIGWHAANHYLKAIIGSVFLFLSLLCTELVTMGVGFYFVSMALCGYGVGLIYGGLPHIISENVNANDIAEAYGLNQVSRSIGYSIGSVISINIICSFFLTSSGIASKYSYLMLNTVGMCFITIIMGLVGFTYFRNHKILK